MIKMSNSFNYNTQSPIQIGSTGLTGLSDSAEDTNKSQSNLSGNADFITIKGCLPACSNSSNFVLPGTLCTSRSSTVKISSMPYWQRVLYDVSIYTQTRPIGARGNAASDSAGIILGCLISELFNNSGRPCYEFLR